MVCAALLIATSGFASEKMDLKSLTQSEFAAKRLTGINPISGSDQ